MLVVSYATPVFLIGPRTLEKRLLIFKTLHEYANVNLWEMFHNLVQILNEALKPRKLKTTGKRQTQVRLFHFFFNEGFYSHLTTFFSPLKNINMLRAGMFILYIVPLNSIGHKMSISFFVAQITNTLDRSIFHTNALHLSHRPLEFLKPR